MAFFLLIPVLLSFLVLGAHFLFHGSLTMVAVSLLLPLLLLIRRRWVPWIIQIALLLAAFEWLGTLMLMINEHQQDGRPWMIDVYILGSVIVFTLASGLVFLAARLRDRYCNVAQGKGFDIVPNQSSC